MGSITWMVTGLFLLGIAGCWIQEDPALLQPSRQDSVHIRVLNLSSDRQERVIVLKEQEVVIGPLPYAGLSPVYTIAADSLRLLVHRLQEEVSAQDTIRVYPGTVVTVVVFTDYLSGRDQLLALVYLPLSETESKWRVRYANLMPTDAEFALAFSCPTADANLSFLSYGQLSSVVEWAVAPPIGSVIRRIGNRDSVWRFVQLSTLAPGQYTAILFPDSARKLQVGILAEAQLQNAWHIAPEAVELQAQLSVANLTDEAVEVKIPGREQLLLIEAWNRSELLVVPACQQLSKDTLWVMYRGRTLSFPVALTAAFEYVAIITYAGQPDSVDVILQVYDAVDTGLTAKIRLYHAAQQGRFVVASGARYQGAQQWHSGEMLAEDLAVGMMSPSVAFPVGALPLMVFDRDSAFRFVRGFVVDQLQPMQYIGILFRSAGQLQCVLLPKGEAPAIIEPLPAGHLLRVVNLQENALEITIPPFFVRSALPPETEIATILPENLQSIEIGQQVAVLTDVHQSRLLIVVPSLPAETTLVENYALPSSITYPAVRFLHAGSDVGAVNVSLDSLQGEVMIEGLRFGQVTTFLQFPRERRSTFVFWDPEDQKLYTRLDNLFVLKGRSYTIVLYRAPSGIRTFVLQEF